MLVSLLSIGTHEDMFCNTHVTFVNVAKQEAMDIAMGWVTKLRQIHHVTESALVDVIEMCKELQSQFLLVVQDAMSNLPVHTECMEQFNDVMSDHSTWPYLFNRLKSPYQRLLYVKQNYPYVVSWKLFKIFCDFCII